MKIGIHNYHEVYNINNAIFDSKMYTIGENLEYPFVKLREELAKEGHSLDTLDVYPIEQYDRIIFLDLPNMKKVNLGELVKQEKKLYLVILESELIRPENMDVKNHKYFEKIFTWNDELVKMDKGKYIKLNVAHKFPDIASFNSLKKEKNCTIIAGNKKCKDKRELYSERIKAIEWFEKKHSNDLDLYGFGWDEYTFTGNKLVKILNRAKFLKKLFGKNYRVYKGTVNSKKEVLSKYKFSICYENAKELRGYITEKIFDCFFAGCVPVYWGAPNVTDYIPENCFIDKRKFETYDKLYSYLKDMREEEYENYLRNIEGFLKSEKAKQFTAEYFAEKIAKSIGE